VRAHEDESALGAAANFEMLHAFALTQDDVMDGSPIRRGRPSAHVAFAQCHRDRDLHGSADRSRSVPRSPAVGIG
jgi:geranylgeranyl diphosphate synthase, type I